MSTPECHNCEAARTRARTEGKTSWRDAACKTCAALDFDAYLTARPDRAEVEALAYQGQRDGRCA